MVYLLRVDGRLAKKEVDFYSQVLSQNQGIEEIKAMGIAFDKSLEELITLKTSFKRKIGFQGIDQEEAKQYLHAVVNQGGLSPIFYDDNSKIGFLSLMYNDDDSLIPNARFGMRAKIKMNNPSYYDLTFGTNYANFEIDNNIINNFVESLKHELGPAYVDPSARSVDTSLDVNNKLDVLNQKIDAISSGQQALFDLVGRVYDRIPCVDDFVSKAIPYLLHGDELGSAINQAISPLVSQLGSVEEGVKRLLGQYLAKSLKASVELDGGTDYNGEYVVDKEFMAETSLLSPIEMQLTELRSNLPVNSAYSGISSLIVNGRSVQLGMKLAPNHSQTIKTLLTPESVTQYFQPAIKGYALQDNDCLPIDVTLDNTDLIRYASVKGAKVKKALKLLAKVVIGNAGTIINKAKTLI